MESILEQKNPLGYEPVRRLLGKFAIPSVIAFLVNNLYNLVDQIFIGQGVGYLGNAATTVAFPVVTITLALAMLFGAGASAYAAIKLGEGKQQVAEKVLNNVFAILVTVGIIISVLGIIFLEPMLRLFGAMDKIMKYATDYTSIILIGTPFMTLSAGLSNMVRTDGNPRLSMISMVVGALLNTILDPIYIFVLDWGVKGAAIATVTSEIISAIIICYYFMKKSKLRLRKSQFKLDFMHIKNFTALGIASSITQLAITVLLVLLNNTLVYYGDQSPVGGDVALSAMGIVMKVSSILIGVNIGISVGAQPIIGFNMGAMQFKRVKETYIAAVISATAFSVVGWIACVFFPGSILKIFGTQDIVFAEFAEKCMRIYLFSIFASGFIIVTTGYFQATGQPFKASVLSMLRSLLLLVPLIIILPLYFGLDGILYAGPVAEFITLTVVVAFIIKEIRMLNERSA
ncbi:MAG: MATE family efflux transporter [Lachnospiraceae bacterium]|nr:MATE family efflux transporter [Lachnospiraceae bacterium]